MKTGFTYDYSTVLFDKFTVFVNTDGELEIANNDTEMVMTHRYTGVRSKMKINNFVELIQKVFPTKQEQIQLLKQLFRD